MRLHFGIAIVMLMVGLNSFAQDNIQIELELISDELISPVAGVSANDGSGRMFIVQQTGQIRILQDGNVLEEPFLDLRELIPRDFVFPSSAFDERGFLGMALHPNFAENGRFFVYYSARGGSSGSNHQSVVAEYSVSADDPNKADSESRVILTVDQPESNHNAGQMAFGPTDGMLYIGLGDGGGGGDQHGAIGNGQNTNNILGAIIRIDVDGAEPYEIPEDNPFVGQDGEDEIWAYGLRNPWRFSFDRGGTHELFCADVGQNRLEEVNIITRGGNYGWRIMEGTDCFIPSTGCDQTGLILPIAEYPHSQGISVTGGYVYRGQRFSSLFGNYVFADWQGSMFYLERNVDNTWTMKNFIVDPDARREFLQNRSGQHITSFAEDENGEIYVLGDPLNSSSAQRPGTIHLLTVPGDEPVSVEQWEKL